MEFLLIMLLVAPLAGLFSGGGAGEDEGGDGPVQQFGDGSQGVDADDDSDHAMLMGRDNDLAIGKAGDDVLAGEAGNDQLLGRDGRDVLLGGEGDDRLDGEADNDLLVGGRGNDTMNGGSGSDALIGSNGADQLRGNDGDDFINGLDVDGQSLRQSADILHPDDQGDFRDLLHRNFGQTMSAAQMDRLAQELESPGSIPGYIGADRLEGGAGDDTLLGNGNDTMVGDSGVDEYRIVEGAGAPVVIADYDPDNEEIKIYLPGTTTGALSFADSANGVEMRIGADVVGILNRTVVADLDPTKVSVFRFDPSL